MKVHVIVEDKVRKRGYLAEHGLSLLIETNHLKVLFDIGATDVFYKNAQQKNLPLDSLDYAVISHGHYDHCHGLTFFMPSSKTKIFIQDAALKPKYAHENNDFREIGLSNQEELVKRLDSNLVRLKGDYRINDHMMIINTIPDKNNFEMIAPGFFTKEGYEITKDLFYDEQILVINCDKGLIVFSGCSHLGIINWLDRVHEYYPQIPIYALFAGMHLEKVSQKQLDYTIAKLEQANISHIFPLHCTGFMATARIKEHFLDKCSLLYTGDTIEI